MFKKIQLNSNVQQFLSIICIPETDMIPVGRCAQYHNLLILYFPLHRKRTVISLPGVQFVLNVIA